MYRFDVLCFFFRRLNDIDQIAPIVFEYSKENKNVHYICVDNNLDFKSHKVIKFLISNGVKVDYLHAFLLKKYQIVFLDFIFFLKNFFHKRLNLLFKIIINECYRSLINKELYIKFLNKNYISTLVFDYPINLNEIFNKFVSLKKNKKLSIIGVEHGILLYKSLFNYKFKPEFDKTKETLRKYDKIIVPNELSKKKLIGLGYNLSNISVSGCPRFTSVWNDVLRNQIYKEKSKNLIQDKIKIIFMDHSNKYGVIENNYLNLIKFFESQKHIDFKIKPNTSNQENSAISSKKISKNLVSNLDSIQLIDWSDIVISINSSIIFDAILNDKIFFYPKYFHDHQMDWDNDPCCIQFDNEKNFFNTLSSLSKKNLLIFKKTIKKQNILERNVFLGNNDDKNFIKDYIEQNLNK